MSSICDYMSNKIDNLDKKYHGMEKERKIETILKSVAIAAITAIGVGILLGLTVNGGTGLAVGLGLGAAAGGISFICFLNNHTVREQVGDYFKSGDKKARDIYKSI